MDIYYIYYFFSTAMAMDAIDYYTSIDHVQHLFNFYLDALVSALTCILTIKCRPPSKYDHIYFWPSSHITICTCIINHKSLILKENSPLPASLTWTPPSGPSISFTGGRRSCITAPARCSINRFKYSCCAFNCCCPCCNK